MRENNQRYIWAAGKTKATAEKKANGWFQSPKKLVEAALKLAAAAREAAVPELAAADGEAGDGEAASASPASKKT